MNSEILAKLRQWWQSLGQTKKILFIAGCVVVLVTVIVLAQLILRPAYAPIFTELAPRDAARIIEQLEGSNISYRLTNEGKNIEVPKDLVYKTRIQMASAGVLQDSGIGFELFDEKKFGITEKEQDIGYQRAMEEELRRTLVQLDGVEQARVHLVLSRHSLFLDDQVTPSASVALKLKYNAKLKPDQVAGIQSLLLGSVEGLDPEHIHIIDMEGNILRTDALDADGDALLAGVTTEQYEMQRKFEKGLEDRVQVMLSRILGSSRAVTMVTAELDFDRQETMRQEHGPGAVLSEQTLDERGTGAALGGVPGTDTEMPGDTVPMLDAGAGSTFEKEQRTTNFEVDTLQQTTIKSLGGVKRLSVSVAVDGEYPEETLNSIRQVVAAAVGFEAARGDQLFVYSSPFSAAIDDDEGAETALPALGAWLTKWYIVAGIILLLALVVLAVILLLRRRARMRQEELELLEAEEAVRLAQSKQKEVLDEMVYTEPTGPRVLIKKVAKDNPAEIVDLLKVWIRE